MNIIDWQQLIFTIPMIIILCYASFDDIRYHRISKKYVIMILLIVISYITILQLQSTQRTFAFLIPFIFFSIVTFASKGKFGFGDTLILGIIGFYIGDLLKLQTFMYTLAVVSLIFGAYFIAANYKQNGNLKDSFKKTTVIPIDKVIPGMILANDYFMEGLTPKDITQLKEQGYSHLNIKYAYPYIPVIFISFLIYLFL